MSTRVGHPLNERTLDGDFQRLASMGVFDDIQIKKEFVQGGVKITVIVREKGALLGRLTPEGYTTNRRIYAAVLSKARAEQITSEINANPPFPGVTATFKPF